MSAQLRMHTHCYVRLVVVKVAAANEHFVPTAGSKLVCLGPLAAQTARKHLRDVPLAQRQLALGEQRHEVLWCLSAKVQRNAAAEENHAVAHNRVRVENVGAAEHAKKPEALEDAAHKGDVRWRALGPEDRVAVWHKELPQLVAARRAGRRCTRWH